MKRLITIILISIVALGCAKKEAAQNESTPTKDIDIIGSWESIAANNKIYFYSNETWTQTNHFTPEGTWRKIKKNTYRAEGLGMITLQLSSANVPYFKWQGRTYIFYGS